MMQRTAIPSPIAALNVVPPGQVPRSPAVRASNLVYLSSMTSIDPQTGEFRPGSVTEQTRTALTNVAAQLVSGGTDLRNAVKVTVHLASILDYEEMNAVYCDFFTGDSLPARTVCAVQMAGGPKVGFECVAAMPSA
ncbi:MAG: endoribonuclease [Betaproteobacteria bacterium]|nr:endoribonuclease [Betaproteobacteria bacterium]